MLAKPDCFTIENVGDRLPVILFRLQCDDLHLVSLSLYGLLL